nr:hypothetical protein [Tanacetum cinerariifolium]
MSTSNSLLTAVLLLIYVSSLAVTNSLCNGGPSCYSGETCCSEVAGYDCCPLANAVCCKGTIYCCPRGSSCAAQPGYCTRYVINAFGEVPTTNQQPAKLKIQRKEMTHEEKSVENQPPTK